MMKKTSLITLAAATLLLGVAHAALADDKPFAGKSITVLLPSPQDATMAADFEKATGIKVDLQTASWDDVSTKVSTALARWHSTRRCD